MLAVHITEYIQKLFELRETGIILNANDNITFSKTSSELFEPFKVLSIGVTDNEFYLNSQMTKSDLLQLNKENLNWFVLKGAHFKEEKRKNVYPLSEGDILKFGRIFVKIWKIHLSNDEDDDNNRVLCRNFSGSNLNFSGASYDNYAHFALHKVIQKNYCEEDDNKLILPRIMSSNNVNSYKTLNLSATSEQLNEKKSYLKKANTVVNRPQCRICYGNDDSIENPLIHPCNCIGSLNKIHYYCLKNWLNAKILNENDNENSEIQYPVKEIECELCKAKYPDFIRHKGKLYNISFYKSKYEKYMVLETIRGDKEKSRTMHIVSFDGRKRVSIGRAGESDVNIADLSVSRFHCFIFKEGNRLYLEDGGSKFGSLVLIQNPKLKILTGVPLKIQFGKCYFNLKIKKKFSFFSCCGALDLDYKKNYQRQNIKYIDVFRNAVILDNKVTDEDEQCEDNKPHIQRIKINKNKKFHILPLIEA